MAEDWSADFGPSQASSSKLSIGRSAGTRLRSTGSKLTLRSRQADSAAAQALVERDAVDRAPSSSRKQGRILPGNSAIKDASMQYPGTITRLNKKPPINSQAKMNATSKDIEKDLDFGEVDGAALARRLTQMQKSRPVHELVDDGFDDFAYNEDEETVKVAPNWQINTASAWREFGSIRQKTKPALTIASSEDDDDFEKGIVIPLSLQNRRPAPQTHQLGRRVRESKVSKPPPPEYDSPSTSTSNGGQSSSFGESKRHSDISWTSVSSPDRSDLYRPAIGIRQFVPKQPPSNFGGGKIQQIQPQRPLHNQFGTGGDTDRDDLVDALDNLDTSSPPAKGKPAKETGPSYSGLGRDSIGRKGLDSREKEWRGPGYQAPRQPSGSNQSPTASMQGSWGKGMGTTRSNRSASSDFHSLRKTSQTPPNVSAPGSRTLKNYKSMKDLASLTGHQSRNASNERELSSLPTRQGSSSYNQPTMSSQNKVKVRPAIPTLLKDGSSHYPDLNSSVRSTESRSSRPPIPGRSSSGGISWQDSADRKRSTDTRTPSRSNKTEVARPGNEGRPPLRSEKSNTPAGRVPGPALITPSISNAPGFYTGFNSGVEGGPMRFDPENMRWVSTLPVEEQEADPFDNLMADDEDEQKGSTIRGPASLINRYVIKNQRFDPKSASESSWGSRLASESAFGSSSRNTSSAYEDPEARGYYSAALQDECRAARKAHDVDIKGWVIAPNSPEASLVWKQVKAGWRRERAMDIRKYAFDEADIDGS